MPAFYDYSNDDGTYEAQHISEKNRTGIRHNNLGHGATCDHCNDAVVDEMRNKIGRIASFKLGRLENKFDKKKWR
jgi:hypothetical protein